jgi:formylglycine-generating enzyme required for sulfatase activity
MKYLKALVCILALAWGCSRGGEEAKLPEPAAGNPVAQKEDLAPPTAVDKGADAGVQPVKLSPEDQKKADQAPAGMVFIKGGCFIMGNDEAQVDERPAHEVCVADFYLDKYEVTQTRWKQAMGYNPAKFQGDDLPVEQVNYEDIQGFIKKSNGQCRLPTEAEWEYALGAGLRNRYYWGNLMDGEYAWFQDNSKETPHPVGQKKPNAFGVYDMAGNVWEWVEDWYEPTYSANESEKDNPKGPAKGEHKVIRGGAFDSSAGALRITNRTWVHPKNRVYTKVTTYASIINEIYNFIGFRCARSIAKGAEGAQKNPVSLAAQQH